MVEINDPYEQYQIVSCNSGKCISIFNKDPNPGGSVRQHTWTGINSQKWTFTRLYDGSYAIISSNGGVCLSVERIESDVYLFTSIFIGSHNQRWVISEIPGEKSFKITSSTKRVVFDVENASQEDDAKILLFFDQGSPNQKWLINRV